MTLRILFCSTAALGIVLAASGARADDYTDLLQILRAKGSLTQGEYASLLAKHRGTRVVHGRRVMVAPEEGPASASAQQAAVAAAQSAAAADAAMRKMEAMQTAMENDPAIVHAMPYKPGNGVTIRVGSVDLNFSAIVNGYYTFSSADNKAITPAGGLSDNSGFDSSAIRNGLLPGAFIASASTTQDGIDITAVFGVYPGIDSSKTTPIGANSGGNPVALASSGIDFRKSYITFGTKTLGTVKVGRDIGIFGSDAILNDATLLSVGAPGGNADPGNTSLGRIGYGYIYTDFIPQISYTTPVFAGFQGTIGVVQPFNTLSLAGSVTDSGVLGTGYSFPLSANSNAHSSPEFEGKLTYDYKGGAWSAHIWTGFMVQSFQNIQVTSLQPVYGFGQTTPLYYNQVTSRGGDKTGVAGEVGATVNFGPVGITGYFYRGSGVGTTGKFIDGLTAAGDTRDSEGGYGQVTWKITPKLKLAGSYGWSSLFHGKGDYDPLYVGFTEATSPVLVARNEAEVGAGYYSITDWLTFVGEYAHSKSTAHNGVSNNSDAVTLGAILFY